MWPKELFPSRDFEHSSRPDTESGTPDYCLQVEVCPRPAPRLGRPELFEAQGNFEGRTDASSSKGKEAQRRREGKSVRPCKGAACASQAAILK